MKRTYLSFLALTALLGLTGAMWALAGAESSAAMVAAVAAVKMVVIGAVFLELDCAWPGWAVAAAAIVGTVLGGAVLLMGA
ncbi:MAG: hypothetical protein Q8P41_08310 [Pseudomonadota bacterium]|nr:hypothetical protein [Pseudomonadota bacterium]